MIRHATAIASVVCLSACATSEPVAAGSGMRDLGAIAGLEQSQFAFMISRDDRTVYEVHYYANRMDDGTEQAIPERLCASVNKQVAGIENLSDPAENNEIDSELGTRSVEIRCG